MIHLVMGHMQSQTLVTNASLSVALASIKFISATTSLFKTLNLSNDPIRMSVNMFLREGEWRRINKDTDAHKSTQSGSGSVQYFAAPAFVVAAQFLRK
jgi:hypothetical protein